MMRRVMTGGPIPDFLLQDHKLLSCMSSIPIATDDGREMKL